MNLAAAVILFGPAAVALPLTAAAWWRHRGEHDAMLAACAQVRAQPPPDGGQPADEPEQLADVIPFPERRAA